MKPPDSPSSPRAVLRVTTALLRTWRDQARAGDEAAARKAAVIAEHVKELKATLGLLGDGDGD